MLQISCSIGVAIYPEHGDSETTLLRLGDEAMYTAKRGGRNAVQVWAPSAPDAQDDHPSARIHVHLRWKPAFACGHAQIDQEHEAFFALANALLDAAELRETHPAAFEAAFNTLLAEATKHFAEEERILQAHGFADLAPHVQLHHSLLERARTLHASAHTSDASAVEGLVQFLVSELVAGHILGADRAFEGLFSQPANDPITKVA